MIRLTVVTTLVLTMLLPSTPAFAQQDTPIPPLRTDDHKAGKPQNIRQAVANYDFTGLAPSGSSQTPASQPRSARNVRSITRKIFGGLLGATAGFFAGGYIGMKIDGNGCNCDDPGLQGVIIGAPIGAVVGAIAGTLMF